MPLPVAVVVGANVGANVAFEYGYQRLKGKRATTKQLVMAGALGSIPLGKVRFLGKHGYRAVRTSRGMNKLGISYKIQAGAAATMMHAYANNAGVRKAIHESVAGLGARYVGYRVKHKLSSMVLSGAYDRTFGSPRRGSMRTETYTPRG